MSAYCIYQLTGIVATCIVTMIITFAYTIYEVKAVKEVVLFILFLFGITPLIGYITIWMFK